MIISWQVFAPFFFNLRVSFGTLMKEQPPSRDADDDEALSGSSAHSPMDLCCQEHFERLLGLGQKAPQTPQTMQTSRDMTDWHHDSLGKLVCYLACCASRDGPHASQQHFCCAPRCFESWFLLFLCIQNVALQSEAFVFFAAWQLSAPVIHTPITPGKEQS